MSVKKLPTNNPLAFMGILANKSKVCFKILLGRPFSFLPLFFWEKKSGEQSFCCRKKRRSA
jgi:hypothetical protein